MEGGCECVEQTAADNSKNRIELVSSIIRKVVRVVPRPEDASLN
jgi:hypothetical protein